MSQLSLLAWQQAYQRSDSGTDKFYAAPCWDWEKPLADRLERLPKPFAGEEISEWRSLLLEHGAEEDHLARLGEFGREGTLAVVTGQQAGAGLGPLYAVYKALAAVRWAREIEEQTGRPVVPVFWVASDDHDVREVSPLVWLGRGDEVRRVELAPRDAGGNAAVSRVPINQRPAEEALRELEESTLETEFRPEILANLREAFLAEGATFESQFLRLFCRWLLPLGILPVVPQLDFMRKRASQVIRREIDESGRVNQLVIDAGQQLKRSGLDPLLHRKGGEHNLFLEVDGIRTKVTRDDGRIVLDSPGRESRRIGETTRDELLSLLESDPGRFSPNVVTRPLVQDSIFPTVAYIPGPGELAYHAQLGPVYELFDVVRPALLPRPNVVLLDARLERSARKIGLSEDDLLAESADAFEEKLAEAARSSEMLETFQASLAELNQALANMEKDLGGAMKDSGVSKSMEKLRSQAETGAEKLRERLERFQLQQDQQRSTAVERLKAGLFPEGTPQERLLGPIAPLLNNYGVEILAQIMEDLDLRAEGMQPVKTRALQKSE